MPFPWIKRKSLKREGVHKGNSLDDKQQRNKEELDERAIRGRPEGRRIPHPGQKDHRRRPDEAVGGTDRLDREEVLQKDRVAKTENPQPKVGRGRIAKTGNDQLKQGRGRIAKTGNDQIQQSRGRLAKTENDRPLPGGHLRLNREGRNKLVEDVPEARRGHVRSEHMREMRDNRRSQDLEALRAQQQEVAVARGNRQRRRDQSRNRDQDQRLHEHEKMRQNRVHNRTQENQGLAESRNGRRSEQEAEHNADTELELRAGGGKHKTKDRGGRLDNNQGQQVGQQNQDRQVALPEGDHRWQEPVLPDNPSEMRDRQTPQQVQIIFNDTSVPAKQPDTSMAPYGAFNNEQMYIPPGNKAGDEAEESVLKSDKEKQKSKSKKKRKQKAAKHDKKKDLEDDEVAEKQLLRRKADEAFQGQVGLPQRIAQGQAGQSQGIAAPHPAAKAAPVQLGGQVVWGAKPVKRIE